MTDTVFDITGKVTIVTGGSTGIGADIAREFCARGARVMITSRTMDHLGPVAEGIRQAGGMIEAMVGDVRQPEHVEAVVNRTVERWGRIDVLINNAGASFVCPAEQISPNGFASIVAINLQGTFLYARAVARVMMTQQTGGSLINIASTAGGLWLGLHGPLRGGQGRRDQPHPHAGHGVGTLRHPGQLHFPRADRDGRGQSRLMADASPPTAGYACDRPQTFRHGTRGRLAVRVSRL
jgi:NAD(P)-dependent dehydrogenase (short-subunit alcohol dehydrogenase family)